MSNTLATLSSKLAQQLADTDHDTWNSNEKDDLVTWAVADLYPRFARSIDPESATVTLVDDDFFYALPTGVKEVQQVDRVTSDGDEAGVLIDGSWATVGGDKLRVAPVIVAAGGTLRVHGFGEYDTTTNLIPDFLVPLVLANARVEAYRRIAGQRARFLQWQASSQQQDVTVNNLLSLTQEAQMEAERLYARLNRTQRRPVPGRLGR